MQEDHELPSTATKIRYIGQGALLTGLSGACSFFKPGIKTAVMLSRVGMIVPAVVNGVNQNMSAFTYNSLGGIGAHLLALFFYYYTNMSPELSFAVSGVLLSAGSQLLATLDEQNRSANPR